MKTSDKLTALIGFLGLNFEVFNQHTFLKGLIKFRTSAGWLDVRDSGDYWAITLMNGKTEHRPLLAGPAFGADILKNTGERKLGPGSLRGAWKTALTIHPVYEETEAAQIFENIVKKINLAYSQYFE